MALNTQERREQNSMIIKPTFPSYHTTTTPNDDKHEHKEAFGEYQTKMKKMERKEKLFDLRQNYSFFIPI